MIVGIYLKNFKCYQGTQYVPIFSNDKNLIAYLGDNGVGKSAILESLEVFFSQRPHWLRNKDSKKGASECFVAPVFLIDNKSLRAEGDYKKCSDALSKEMDIDVPIDHILVCIAKVEDGSFSLFNGKKEILSSKVEKSIETFYKTILGMYQYIYVDAEVDIDEQAKLNSDVYEVIMGSSIITEVENKFKESDVKKELISGLNNVLERFIDDNFVKKLKEIDEDYSYESTQGATSKLTQKVLARASTEAFLSSRKLKHNRKQLDSLSSGQRRTALLDFLSAALSASPVKKREVILAIDEPEISLDAGNRMKQFEKLVDMSKKGIGVMFTSHWYGWILGTNTGSSVLIEKKEDSNDREITTHNNEDFPFKDIAKYEMRMIFDFLMALGASAEAYESMKFIICEGYSDKIYLQASLHDSSYRIIPIGKGQVKRIASIFKDYYWKDGGPKIKNVLFLTDTDPEHGDKNEYDNKYLWHWSKDGDSKVSLENGQTNFMHSKCVIEDILEPFLFLEALQNTYQGDTFFSELSIKYPDLLGPDSFGLDVRQKKNFDTKTKGQKIGLANKYLEIMEKKYSPDNKLKLSIEASFGS
jgi:energy-coupling factor transporter ATP-binding protein EcfA2